MGMTHKAMVSKWGNSLAIRIPKEIAKQARLNEGDCLVLALQQDGAIVLRSTRPRYKLSDLVSRITSKNRHGETDCGTPLSEEL
jgi:antitoxin MazE